MNKSFTFVLVAAAFLAGSSLGPATAVMAQTTTRPATKTHEAFTVVQVGDDAPKVIRTADLASEKKQATDDYKKALEDWKVAKKTDKTAEKPKAPKFKKLKAGFKSQQDAQDFIDKLGEKTGGAAGDKDKGKDKGKDTDKTNPPTGF